MLDQLCGHSVSGYAGTESYKIFPQSGVMRPYVFSVSLFGRNTHIFYVWLYKSLFCPDTLRVCDRLCALWSPLHLSVHACAKEGINKSPSPNVRYYLGAKQKDKADTASSEKVKGKQGGEALGKGWLAPVKIGWMWTKYCGGVGNSVFSIASVEEVGTQGYWCLMKGIIKLHEVAAITVWSRHVDSMYVCALFSFFFSIYLSFWKLDWALAMRFGVGKRAFKKEQRKTPFLI